MPRAQCCVSIQHEFRNERPSSIASALSSILVLDPRHDVDLDAERRSAVLAGLAVAGPIGDPEIMRTEVASIRKAALELLLLEDIAVVRDLLARVFVIVDQAVAHAIGLMKPDRCRVVADIPKGVDLLILIVRHKADAASNRAFDICCLKYVPSSDA